VSVRNAPSAMTFRFCVVLRVRVAGIAAGVATRYELAGKKAKFLNFRHTGASNIAQRGRDPRHLLAVGKMMGYQRCDR
jgi:hypothetical protein